MHQTYDPRLRNAIARSGNPNLSPKLSIPRTTADTWIRDGVKEFVTDPVFEICNSALVAKVILLEFELAQERAKVALLKSAQIATGFSMQYVRVATAELKTKLLSAIDATAKLIPFKETLNIIDVSSARYFSWIKRKVLCQLPDQSSCPKLTPTKITSSEKSVIRELVTSKEYIHFSISSLALYANSPIQTENWNSSIDSQPVLAPGPECAAAGIRTRELTYRVATPREMLLGIWTTDDDLKLLQHSEHARQQRKVANLTFSCGACPV